MARERHTDMRKPGLAWLFFSFRGRIARQSYFLAALFQITLLTIMVYQSVRGAATADAGGPESQLIFGGFLAMIILPFILWSGLALATKRLHDLNHPVALIVLYFIPGVNYLFVLYTMLRPSHPKTNAHGPPPFGET